jgi:hypothetical protein
MSIIFDFRKKKKVNFIIQYSISKDFSLGKLWFQGSIDSE